VRRGSQRPYRSCQRLQGAPVLRSQPAAVYAGVEWRFFEEVLLGAGTQASPLQGWRERTAVRKLSGTAQLHSLVRYTDYMEANKGLSSPVITGLFWVFGVIIWTLLEYTLHRCLFHVDE
jgi:hypothetical protein